MNVQTSSTEYILTVTRIDEAGCPVSEVTCFDDYQEAHDRYLAVYDDYNLGRMRKDTTVSLVKETVSRKVLGYIE